MIVLSTFLKEAREQAKMTQWELAQKMGYKTSQIVSNWERGLCGLPIDKAKTFCKVTDINPEQLAGVIVGDYEGFVKKRMQISKKKAS